MQHTDSSVDQKGAFISSSQEGWESPGCASCWRCSSASPLLHNSIIAAWRALIMVYHTLAANFHNILTHTPPSNSHTQELAPSGGGCGGNFCEKWKNCCEFVTSLTVPTEVGVCMCEAFCSTPTSTPLGTIFLLFCVICRSHLELTWTRYRFTWAAVAKKSLLRQNKMHGAATKCQYLMSCRRGRVWQRHADTRSFCHLS